MVPAGDLTGIERIPNVIWQHLSSPDQPLKGVSGIVADLRSDLSDAWERFVADAALAGVPVYHIKQVTESLSGRAEIEHLSRRRISFRHPIACRFSGESRLSWVEL